MRSRGAAGRRTGRWAVGWGLAVRSGHGGGLRARGGLGAAGRESVARPWFLRMSRSASKPDNRSIRRFRCEEALCRLCGHQEVAEEAGERGSHGPPRSARPARCDKVLALVGCHRRGLRAVAQLGSALDWGSGGRSLKSCQPDKTTASDLRKRGSEAVSVLTWIPRMVVY